MSKLPSIMKITFEVFSLSNPISLWFSNTVLKIFQNDRKGFTLFKWKSFKFEIQQKYMKYIKGVRHWTGPYSDWFILRLESYNKVEFEDFNKISNKEQAAEIDRCFPRCISDSKWQWTVFILAKDLIEAKLNSCIFSRKTHFGAVQWLISNWLKLKSYIFRLSLPWDLEDITNISYLPLKNMELVVSIDSSQLQL